MPTRFRLVLFAIGVGLVAAEGLLQLGYLVTWCSRSGRDVGAPTAGDGPTVLCVGDSFTYGLGASSRSHSYPAQLEARLRDETGAAWRVVNRGWPGRHSREVLESIDAHLAETRPAVVCIAVGVNDEWVRPDALILPDAAAGAAPAPAREPYVVTCRLWRLVTAFRSTNPFRDRPAVAPAVHPPIAGEWTLADSGVPVRFEADGSGTVGDAPLAWKSDGDQVVLTIGGAAAVRCTCRDDGGTLVLAIDEVAAEWRLVRARRPAPTRDPRHEAQLAAQRGDWPAAVAAYTEALESPPAGQEIALRAARIHALCAAGRRDQARADLEIVRGLFAANPAEPWAATELMHAIGAVGTEREQLEFARGFLASNRGTFAMWALYSQLLHNAGDLATARTAIDAAIEAMRQDGGAADWLWIRRAGLYLAEHEVVELAEALTAAQGFDSSVRMYLRASRASADAKDEALRTVAARRGAPAVQLERLLRLRREADGEGAGGLQQVLESHLRQAIVRCHRAGARVLLVSYPFWLETRSRLQLLAASENCTFVPVDEAIAAVKKAEPGRELQVPDGHCNDDGYGVMAARVAEAMRALPVVHAAPAPVLASK